MIDDAIDRVVGKCTHIVINPFKCGDCPIRLMFEFHYIDVGIMSAQYVCEQCRFAIAQQPETSRPVSIKWKIAFEQYVSFFLHSLLNRTRQIVCVWCYPHTLFVSKGPPWILIMCVAAIRRIPCIFNFPTKKKSHDYMHLRWISYLCSHQTYYFDRSTTPNNLLPIQI